jgi:PAP2 superfamily/Wax ester synthase/diacylglycerol acyltransferase catalytic domain/WS/DGAT C-terminal domain
VTAGAPVRPPAWRQVALVLAVLAVYLVGAGRSDSDQTAARAHGRALWDLEQRLHVGIEPTLNSWLAERGFLRTVANYEYAVIYVTVAFTVLLWIYLRRPEHYRHAQLSFLLVNLAGIGCFFGYPVAPPRLLPDLGFVDTVALGGTVGSWGWSPVVAHANDVAAMPSLHVAWSLWALAMLIRASRRRLLWVASGVQVAVTTVVVMATANHWLLDAAAGALLVVTCVAVTVLVQRRRPGRPLGPADAFFVHIESPSTPQQVGGVALLEHGAVMPTRADLERVVRSAVAHLPRFRQRLIKPTRWRRARWVDHPQLDWDWHVPDYDLRPVGPAGSVAAVHRMIAELAATQLPDDRPMWRLGLVRAEPDCAVVLLVHHALADGFGVIAQARYLTSAPPSALEAGAQTRHRRPVRTAVAIVAGLAQLATDGRPDRPLPGGDTPDRRFDGASVELELLRSVADRQRVRITDIVLSAVAGGLRRVHPDPDGLPANLRVAVPLTARPLGSNEAGNRTAGVITDVPLGEMTEIERLGRTALLSGRLRTRTRVLASGAVLRLTGAVLPPHLHARFARAVYGRRYFHAIVSNMPGPREPLTVAGAPIGAVFPILPLAPGSPLAVGALGWSDRVHFGVAAHPDLVPDAAALTGAIVDIVTELATDAGPATWPVPTGAGTSPRTDAAS